MRPAFRKSLLTIAFFAAFAILFSVQVNAQVNAQINAPANMPVNESDAGSALARSYSIRYEMEVLAVPHAYVDDMLLNSQSAFDGQDVTTLVSRIYSIKNFTEQEAFIAALNTTFTPDEIARIRLKEAKIRYNYSQVIINQDLIIQRQKQAYLILDQIAVLDQYLSSGQASSYNISEVFELRSLIKQKFSSEQFDEILPLLERAFRRYEDIQIEASRSATIYEVSKRGINNYLKNYWPQIVVISIILIVVLLIAYNEYRVHHLKNSINRLGLEKKVLQGLIVAAQKGYFADRSVSKSDYEIKVQKYNERLLKIKENFPVVQSSLRRSLKARRLYFIFSSQAGIAAWFSLPRNSRSNHSKHKK